jgi:hypothetical protein
MAKGPITKHHPIDEMAARAVCAPNRDARQQIMRSMKNRYGKPAATKAMLEMIDVGTTFGVK